MITPISKNIAALCVSMSIFACLGSGSRAVAADKVSARTLPESVARSASIVSNTVAVVEVPESVFVDVPERKDPFFPNAEYRKQKKHTPAPSPGVGGDAVLKQLKLTGFGGIGDKRWAMVNGVSVYLNEASGVSVGGKTYKIIGLEMKEQSIIVGMKDTPAQRELKLDN